MTTKHFLFLLLLRFLQNSAAFHGVEILSNGEKTNKCNFHTQEHFDLPKSKSNETLLTIIALRGFD